MSLRQCALPDESPFRGIDAQTRAALLDADVAFVFAASSPTTWTGAPRRTGGATTGILVMCLVR